MSTDVLEIRGDGTSTSGTIPDIPGPQLPGYTFDAGTGGTPASGQLQLNNASPTSTTALYFNETPKGSPFSVASFFIALPPQAIIVLTSASGTSYIFQIQAPPTVATGVVTVSVGQLASNTTAFSGDYALSFAPGYLSLANVLLDSGITPCADGTVTPVTSITTSGGIITAIS